MPTGLHSIVALAGWLGITTGVRSNWQSFADRSPLKFRVIYVVLLRTMGASVAKLAEKKKKLLSNSSEYVKQNRTASIAGADCAIELSGRRLGIVQLFTILSSPPTKMFRQSENGVVASRKRWSLLMVACAHVVGKLSRTFLRSTTLAARRTKIILGIPSKGALLFTVNSRSLDGRSCIDSFVGIATAPVDGPVSARIGDTPQLLKADVWSRRG